MTAFIIVSFCFCLIGLASAIVHNEQFGILSGILGLVCYTLVFVHGSDPLWLLVGAFWLTVQWFNVVFLLHKLPEHNALSYTVAVGMFLWGFFVTQGQFILVAKLINAQ